MDTLRLYRQAGSTWVQTEKVKASNYSRSNSHKPFIISLLNSLNIITCTELGLMSVNLALIETQQIESWQHLRSIPVMAVRAITTLCEKWGAIQMQDGWR